MEIEEEWGDSWEDEEWPDEDYGDEEADVVACPECGQDVYEDAEFCPACGNYIVHRSSSYVWTNRPTWWILLGLLGILAVILSLAFGPT